MKDISKFDYRTAEMNVCETYIRDDLDLKIKGWADFREAIIAGVEADKYLKAKDGANISEQVEDSYRDLGKCNYQVITNLGYAFQEFCSASAQERGLIRLCRLWHDHEEDWRAKLEYGQANLRFNMTISSFYSHFVSVLDGLSHLVFIIFHPCSATKQEPHQGRQVPVRKRINWHRLTIGKYHDFCEESGFKYLREDEFLKEIVSIRNQLTHAWIIPHSIPRLQEGEYKWCWPQETKCEEWLAWPQEPAGNDYDYSLAVIPLATKHFRHVENLLDKKVFPDLTKGIPKWEENNRVEIKEPISGKTPQEKCERSLQPPTPPLPSAGISDMYLQRDGESA